MGKKIKNHGIIVLNGETSCLFNLCKIHLKKYRFEIFSIWYWFKLEEKNETFFEISSSKNNQLEEKKF